MVDEYRYKLTEKEACECLVLRDRDAVKEVGDLKIGVMQPYLFPYIGYFHLAASVDALVLRDMGQFTKGSWITRNRLEYSHGLDWFTIPTQKSSVDTQIREKLVSPDWTPQHLRRKIEPALFDLPNRKVALELIDTSLELSGENSTNLFDVLYRTLKSTFKVLGINCTVLIESSLKLPNQAGIDGVLDICTSLSATQYVNLPGGRALYSKEAFEMKGLKLSFVEPSLTRYTRGGRAWQAGLSIIDAIAGCSQTDLRRSVNQDFVLSQ